MMLMRLRHLTAFAAFGLLATVGTHALGASCIGVSIPDSAKAGSADLALNGSGIRKATFLNVKVYVASLYLPQKSSDAAHILATQQPWHLVLNFVHDVDAGEMRDAFDDGFKKTAGSKFASLEPRIKTLNDSLVDFKEGNYLAFTNDPAKGVTVDVNGAKKIQIEGADFSNALLAIWLGADPPNKDLKSGLLGGKCE
jgi:chalcone isomerase-like protein